MITSVVRARVPADTAQLIGAEAERRGVTVSAFVREVLAAYFDRENPIGRPSWGEADLPDWVTEMGAQTVR